MYELRIKIPSASYIRRNNYFCDAIAFHVDVQHVAIVSGIKERTSAEISGDFHRNATVYHAVKNIARIIRRCSNWIYIHRDSRGPVYQRHEGTRAGINGFFSE